MKFLIQLFLIFSAVTSVASAAPFIHASNTVTSSSYASDNNAYHQPTLTIALQDTVSSKSKTDVMVKNDNMAAENQSSVQQHTNHRNWWLAISGFWLFGLLIGLTTCAIPIILIMTSICGFSSEHSTRKKALALTFTYVLSLSLTYSLVGFTVAALGMYFHAYIQNVWVIGVFSSLFVVLGFSALGVFHAKLPKKWINIITVHHQLRNYGAFVSAFTTGVLATLIALPCVAAPLLAVLAYVASVGDIQYGAISLFLTGVGFGTPLIGIYVIGTELLQRAGAWQHHIRNLFALTLFAIAILLLGRIIPENVVMYLWATLIISTAVFIDATISEESPTVVEDSEPEVCSLDGVVIPQKHVQRKNISALWNMFCLMILLYGMIVFIGALLGNVNPLSPLDHQKTPQVSHAESDVAMAALLNINSTTLKKDV